MGQQHPQLLAAYRLHMHWPIQPRPHHLRHAAGIIAISLVDLSLQRCARVPRLYANSGHARLGQSAEQPLRQWPRFQSDPLEVIGPVLEHLQESGRIALNLRFPDNPTCVIHNAQARQLDRYVPSSKILHAALLLLMLEALITVTSFHHQPEAQHPISSSIHKNAGRLPHLLMLWTTPPSAHNSSDVLMNQIVCKSSQSNLLPFGPAILNFYVAALDVACLAESFLAPVP